MAKGKTPIEQPAGGDECILLHDSLPLDQGTDPESERGTVLFADPAHIITCWHDSDLEAAFDAIERAVGEGLYVSGAFAYELGYHLEPKLAPLAPESDEPLFQVGAFRTMRRLEANASARVIKERKGQIGASWNGSCASDGLRYHLDSASYDVVMKRLHEYILAGDIYQANFTFPLNFLWSGNVWQLYDAVAPFQRVPFGAVVDLPQCKLASLSPELFFRKRGDTIESRPMKGTMKRGGTVEEDASLREMLHLDPKNRAENLMIVDLIRNDLGRMARLGSVSVDSLFQVETYGTLHQMVSTVRAEVAGEPTVLEIFQHLFPCGSVTGAPKIRAMEIIAELETGPRGIYTGAIGYVTPSRDMCMSVPIRTMNLGDDGEATMGIGSGVVSDSSAVGEYEECLLKARFLKEALSSNEDVPGLIETMLCIDGDIALIEDHQTRLKRSAAYLGITMDDNTVWEAVIEHASGFSGRRRIRFQLGGDGSWRIESSTIKDLLLCLPTVVIAAERLESDDPLLAHKSTRREIYNKARSVLDDVENGFDVLLFNERGELCEGAISNIFLLIDGQLVTPDLECGLLPGIMRAQVLKERGAIEQVLYEEDLHRAEKVYLSNAVRGLIEVQVQS